MKNALLRITGADRVMVLAVHPDDESLATGGLLQRAVAAGAAVRVLFVTDGENNPWPQRVLERRWRIGPGERTRWGRLRRAEAMTALRVLGVGPGCARFLGWPDQGLTALLLGDQATAAIRTLAGHVQTWRPTVLLVPSLRDRHPDHNALAVLVRFALERLETEDHAPRPTVFHYLVHGQEPPGAAAGIITLPLSVWEKRTKALAISQHTSQLLLSRRRFLSYATDEERFGFTKPREDRVVSSADGCRGTFSATGLALEWTLEKPLRALERPTLHLVFASQTREESIVALTVPVRGAAGRAPVLPALGGVFFREAAVRVERRRILVHLPIAPRASGGPICVKLQRRGGAFLDLNGWEDLTPSNVARSSTRLPTGLPLAQASRTR